MYIQSNIKMQLHNHWCSGNTVMYFAHVVELHVTVNYIEVSNVPQRFCGTFMSLVTIKCV